MEGPYPYYGPTGRLDSIADFRLDGTFALIGEDGDHFLDVEKKPQTILVSGKFNVNNHAHVIESTDMCSAEWFYNYFRHRSLTPFLTRQGAGRYKLNKAALQEIPIILPPAEQQSAINALFREWATAIQKTEQLIAAKERHYSHEPSRLISRGQHPHAHVGAFAEEVSARNRGGKWRTVALSDIATVWKGQQLNRDAMDEDGAYYALNGGIKPSGRTTEWNCEADTITVSSGGNSCGFIRFNSERFWCGGDCFALKKLSSKVDVSYLLHYLKGQQHRMMALRTGSGIPHVYRADVEAFLVALPDLATQTAIARYLNAMREEIDLLGQSVAALRTQKRGLMQKMLTGQWRVLLSALQSQHGNR
jgi:type I restriction enzyme S subunit